MSRRRVRIHYRRLPEREDVFEQEVLEDAGAYVVTFLAAAELRAPLRVAGRAVLEPGAPVIWFTYPGRWYDIGIFHLADGTRTGLYANLLTPVTMAGDRWETTDLCLDLWLGADGALLLLDEDELDEALAARWLDPALARRRARRRAHWWQRARRGVAAPRRRVGPRAGARRPRRRALNRPTSTPTRTQTPMRLHLHPATALAALLLLAAAQPARRRPRPKPRARGRPN